MTYVVHIGAFLLLMSMFPLARSYLQQNSPVFLASLRGSKSQVRFLRSTSLYAKKTGGFFRALPDIHPAKIHYSRALKDLRKIRFDGSIKNAKNAQRKLSAQSLDTIMKSLTVPITGYMHVYKNRLKELHPYEVRTYKLGLLLFFLLHLTISHDSFHHIGDNYELDSSY